MEKESREVTHAKVTVKLKREALKSRSYSNGSQGKVKVIKSGDIWKMKKYFYYYNEYGNNSNYYDDVDNDKITSSNFLGLTLLIFDIKFQNWSHEYDSSTCVETWVQIIEHICIIQIIHRH